MEQEELLFALALSGRIHGVDQSAAAAVSFIGGLRISNRTITDILLQSGIRHAHKWPVQANDAVLPKIANPAGVEAGLGVRSWDSSFERHSEVLREDNQGR